MSKASEEAANDAEKKYIVTSNPYWKLMLTTFTYVDLIRHEQERDT
jgi:hypothetical protein